MDISTDCFDISPEFLVVYPTIIGEHLVLILFMGISDQCCNVILDVTVFLPCFFCLYLFCFII